jgi:hypothetical protein
MKMGLVLRLIRYPAMAALYVAALLLAACSDDEPVAPPAEPDSSSHAFTWEEISNGDDHSYLKDVYAINDTDVWAVGCITTRDTLQSWKPLIKHNAVHWDGREWKIVDVRYHCRGRITFSQIHWKACSLLTMTRSGLELGWYPCGTARASSRTLRSIHNPVTV